MDIKEAIRIVNQAPIWENEEVGKALEVLVEASKKQIAKKPTLILDKTQNPPLYRCDCGMMSYFFEYEYCDDCGQKLDWGKNEE